MLKSIFSQIGWGKRKRKITLQELDSIMLKHIDEGANKTNNKEVKIPTICLKCSGKLLVVVPLIKMKEMILFECSTCKERFYFQGVTAEILPKDST